MTSLTRRFSSFKNIKLLLLLPTMFVALSFIGEGSGKELKLGKKAPLFTLQMEECSGKSESLESLKQTNGIIVVFSCNTCPFVVGNDGFEGWERQYNELNQIASTNNFGFVLVNSNEAKRDGADSKEEMIQHAKDADYKMPYLVDKDSKLADAFGAKTTPHVFVFNADDKLIYKGSIDNIWDSKRTEDQTYLRNLIEEVGAGQKFKSTTTPPRGCSIKRV